MSTFSDDQFIDGIRMKAPKGTGRTSDKAERLVFNRKKEPEETSGAAPAEKAEDAVTGFIEKLARDRAGEENFIIVKPTESEEEEKSAEISESRFESGLEEDHRTGLTNRLQKRSFVRLGLLTGSVAAILLAILVSTIFARVTLTLKPRVENVAVQDLVAAFDTSVSQNLVPQKVVPAELLRFSRSVTEEFESSGRELIQEQARGKVKLYNRFSSSPQILVINTRFLTDSGVLFRLPKTITVPGARIEEGKIVPNFIETELVADKPGEESNVGGEATLKIPGFKGTSKYEGFFAVAPQGFSGGFQGEARVVSEDDLKRAQEQVTKKVFDELKLEISRKVPHDFKVIETLREIQITSVDAPRKNMRRDSFSVQAQAAGRILIFREKDVTALLGEVVLKDDKTKKLIENSADLNYFVRSVNFEKGRAEAVLYGSVKIKTIIPQEEIAGSIRGKKEGSIIEILKSRSDIASFSVAFFPPWLFSAPQDTTKIRFIIIEPQLNAKIN